MHNNRNKKHVREDDVMLPALAHEKHHAMGVQLLVDLIDLKRAGRSADCSAQTSDSRRTSFIVYFFSRSYFVAGVEGSRARCKTSLEKRENALLPRLLLE